MLNQSTKDFNFFSVSHERLPPTTNTVTVVEHGELVKAVPLASVTILDHFRCDCDRDNVYPGLHRVSFGCANIQAT
jgi:hypothetical protein